VEIRRASEDDLPAQLEVFRAAIGALFARHDLPPPNPTREQFENQQRHLMSHDGERSLVATEGDRVVAFAASFVRGDAWFLSSLFVRPEAQGLGIGPALLDATWLVEAKSRRTMTDAIQPASNGLYAQRGLAPTTPVFRLVGRPGGTAVAAGVEASEPDESALATLDDAAYGFHRAPDHDYWGRLARATLWRRDGEPVAYSYVWPSGHVGPVAGRDAEAAAAALTAELALVPGAGASVLVPGSARRLLEAALAAGLRISGPPGLLLLSEGLEPPTALAPGGFALF
jgi:GNAT superfamily N-acetyltransferase